MTPVSVVGKNAIPAKPATSAPPATEAKLAETPTAANDEVQIQPMKNGIRSIPTPR